MFPSFWFALLAILPIVLAATCENGNAVFLNRHIPSGSLFTVVAAGSTHLIFKITSPTQSRAMLGRIGIVHSGNATFLGRSLSLSQRTAISSSSFKLKCPDDVTESMLLHYRNRFMDSSLSILSINDKIIEQRSTATIGSTALLEFGVNIPMFLSQQLLVAQNVSHFGLTPPLYVDIELYHARPESFRWGD
jgi:hypothetical protein